MKSALAIALGAFLIQGSFAYAQTAAPATAPATAPAAKPAAMAKPAAASGAMAPAAKGGKARTAASLACSKDADSKNIHGKKRKTYMSTCKKAGGPT